MNPFDTATPRGRRQPHRRRRILHRWLGSMGLLLVAVALGLYAAAGFFARDPVHLFNIDPSRPVAGAPTPPLGVLLFSGDMGLGFGMSPAILDALIPHGLPIVAIASSTRFARHQDRAGIDAAVADAVRIALARTHARTLVVIGQSFGADIARVGLVDLPADLRPRIAGAVLVVPGRDAYFRADPLGIAYWGKAEAEAADARRLDWLPLLCIGGQSERDSLCPLLDMPNVRSRMLPGDHYLGHDPAPMQRTLLAEMARLPALRQTRDRD